MTIKCGLVGAGDWMRHALLPALRAQDGVEIVGCVAATEAESAHFAANEGIGRAFPSLVAMLSGPNRPEMVVIATPDHVHAAAVTAALEAGVAAYCEKPLANQAGSAAALAGLAESSGVPATVGYSFRFTPAVQALKRDLAAGRLGTPWLIELAEHNPQFHPHGGKAPNWKHDPAQAGAGALFEYGSHVVDLAAWLLGPVRRVATTLQHVLPGARLDDIATVQMQFASGATGLLVASWVLSGGFPGIRIRLHGSEALGEVWVDDRLPGGHRYHLTPAHRPGEEEVRLDPMTEPRTEAVRRHLADFLAGLGGRETLYPETLPTLRQGAQVQAILDAALASTSAWRDVATL